MHGLGDEADLAKIEAADGAIKALYELRDQKVARFIGMTSHTDGAVMARAIERNDLDCVQMAMNPTRALRFEELALPAANRKNLGVIQMKVMGQDKLVGDGKGDPMALLRYAWSLPISTTVCGMPKLEMLEANVATARAFASPLLACRDGPAAPAVRRPHRRHGALLRAPRRRRRVVGLTATRHNQAQSRVGRWCLVCRRLSATSRPLVRGCAPTASRAACFSEENRSASGWWA